ncbi:MAG: hypothetical protein ACRD88_11555, partial [Terriglobia bacterium]
SLLLVGLLAANSANRSQPSALECTLTGQKIQSCCCQIRQGKLYCPLANQTISKCCCKPVGA